MKEPVAFFAKNGVTRAAYDAGEVTQLRADGWREAPSGAPTGPVIKAPAGTAGTDDDESPATPAEPAPALKPKRSHKKKEPSK